MNNILNLRILFLFCVLVLRCSVDLEIAGDRELPQSLRQNSDDTTLPDDTILSCWNIFSAIPDKARAFFLQTYASVNAVNRMSPEMPNISALLSALFKEEGDHGQKEKRQKGLVDRQDPNIFALFVEWMSLVQEEQGKIELIRHDGQKAPALLEEKRVHAQQEQKAEEIQRYKNLCVQKRLEQKEQQVYDLQCHKNWLQQHAADADKHSRPTPLSKRYLNLFEPDFRKQCLTGDPKAERFQSIKLISKTDTSLHACLIGLKVQHNLYSRERERPSYLKTQTRKTMRSVRRFEVLNHVTAALPKHFTELNDEETLKNQTSWMQAVRAECDWVHAIRLREGKRYNPLRQGQSNDRD